MKGKILNNRYQVNNIIGTGGMAIVYDGYDTLLNRPVAIKILKDSFVDDENFFNRLKEEAKASASIIDDNIVSIYDIATTEINGKAVDYIIMEKIEGPTLKEVIAEKAPLKAEQTLDFAMQIAKALQSAHLDGLVHRDIKPANILLNKDGKIKVVDFGIARIVSDATLTYTSTILGTVHYISPEQAKGQPLDSRSDLYSLGVVLYEMATGQVPFDGESPVSIAVKHIQEKPRFVSSVNPEYSDDFSNIINKLLAKNPDDRYKTASNLLIDLNKLKNGQRIASIDDTVIIAGGAKVANEKNTDSIPSKKDTIKTNAVNKSENISDTNPQKAIYKSKSRGKSQESIGESFKKNNKKLIALFIALALLLAFGIFKLMDLFTSKDDHLVNVPSLVDISETQAVELLNKLGLTSSIKERVFESSIEKGNVISQSINAQEKVEKGTNVELTISKGPEYVELPDIVGLSLEDAERYLSKYGLNVGDQTTEKSDKEKDSILKQFPAAGEKVEKGSKVDITKSSGPEEKPKIPLPDVTGKDINDARKTLTDLGFTIASESYEASESKEGVVIAQDLKAGESYKEGSSLNIVISKGPDIKYTNVPNVVKLDQNSAIRTISDAELNLSQIATEYSNDIGENMVISQSISPGERVEVGTKISITVSLGPNKKNQTSGEVASPKRQNKKYAFMLSVPANVGDKFNVKIYDVAIDKELVYNKDVKSSDAVDGQIKVELSAFTDSKFEVYYNDKKANVVYE